MKEFYNDDGSKPKSKGTVFANQIKYNPILSRIDPYCENCGQDYSYHIHTKKLPERNNNFLEVLLSRQTRYYISCPKCKFVMELDYKEYKELKKIADKNGTEGRY